MNQINSITAIHYETMRTVKISMTGDIIRSITEIEKTDDDLPVVAPGLIDNQVNGYAGVDFSGDQLTVEGIVKAAISLRESGVTTFLPTQITNSPQNLIRNFRVLASALTNREVALSVPGFHLEGPYLSKLDGFRGCHPEEYISNPDTEQFDSFQQAACGKIIQITLAPELPGSRELISHCAGNKVLVAIGHTNATSQEIKNACLSGASLSTHLGNGCANMIHRHNNPIWPQLAEEKLTATVIADGHHLLPEELKVFLKVKGSDNVILTSDITYLSGMPAGRYSFGGADVILTADGRLRSAEQDVLAGASLPLLRGVENMIRFTGCSLAEAIRMASGNVARIFGWDDRGELLPGKRADLLLLKRNGSELSVKRVFVAGEEVWGSA